MFKRQRSGSVVCPSCGFLVGVKDDRCYNCGRANPSLWGFAPAIRALGEDLGFLYVIMAGTIGLYVITLLWSMRMGEGGGPSGLLAPDSTALLVFGGSGAIPVFRFGRWWTVLSASWLHGNLLHIFFNLYAVRQLAPATAHLFGPGRTVIIYTVAGVAGFTLSSVMGVLIPYLPIIHGGLLTIGASASIMGLVGAFLCYSHRTGSHLMGSIAWQYVSGTVLFGLLMPGIDNWAHAGGFAGGYLAAYVLNPLKAERVDHLLLALVCLLASAASVIVSVVTAYMQ
jgi:rhomboid protease GluP